MVPAPMPDPPPSLGLPTPPPEEEPAEGEDVSITKINLDDSAEINQENLQALLERAKRAGKTAAKKTRMAFDSTQALADSGALRLPPKSRKFTRQETNGTKSSSNGAGG